MNRKPPDKTGAKRTGFGARASSLRKASSSKTEGAKTGGSRGGGFGANRKPPDPKAVAQRAALNALKRAKRQADRAGVKLSEWEGEFLGSVADRLKTYGRAFGDPEKGAPGQALSAMQTVKLKEITAKAKGEKKAFKRRTFRRKAKPEDGEA